MQRRAQHRAAMRQIGILIVGWRLPLRERHRQRMVAAPERLQRHHAIVADLGQCAADRRPVDVPGAEEAAMVLVGLEMDQVRAAARIACGRSFSSMFMWKVSSMMPTADRSTSSQIHRLPSGVAEIGFEPVQRLDRETPLMPHAAAGAASQARPPRVHPFLPIAPPRSAPAAAPRTPAACRTAARRRCVAPHATATSTQRHR